MQATLASEQRAETKVRCMKKSPSTGLKIMIHQAKKRKKKITRN